MTGITYNLEYVIAVPRPLALAIHTMPLAMTSGIGTAQGLGAEQIKKWFGLDHPEWTEPSNRLYYDGQIMTDFHIWRAVKDIP